MNAFKKFMALYDSIEKEITYSDDFNDHVGYFKPLVDEDLPLQIHESGKFITPFGKRVIVIRTANYHNVVIFQQHADQPLIMCSYNYELGYKMKYNMWEPLNNKSLNALIDFIANDTQI